MLPASTQCPTQEAFIDIISSFAARYEHTCEEELSLEDYLAECKRNPLAYASAAERMLRAIGEPQMVDTRNDPRLSRIFANKLIKRYPAFAEFYGMEDAIEQVVSYFRHAAQGLEERKQILYLLGPVGGGMSSIAERLKVLMQGRCRSTRSRVHRSTKARSGCLMRPRTARFSKASTASRVATSTESSVPGRSNDLRSTAVTSAGSRSSSVDSVTQRAQAGGHQQDRARR